MAHRGTDLRQGGHSTKVNGRRAGTVGPRRLVIPPSRGIGSILPDGGRRSIGRRPGRRGLGGESDTGTSGAARISTIRSTASGSQTLRIVREDFAQDGSASSHATRSCPFLMRSGQGWPKETFAMRGKPSMRRPFFRGRFAHGCTSRPARNSLRDSTTWPRGSSVSCPSRARVEPRSRLPPVEAAPRGGRPARQPVGPCLQPRP